MALTLESYPTDLSSVSSECLFVVSSTEALDPVTYPNYKFVCDVYVASTLVARLKAFPDPTNSLEYSIYQRYCSPISPTD